MAPQLAIHREGPRETEPAISVQHLSKSYSGRLAVRDLCLEVSAGEVLALLGPNGAGKTTTVETLEGYRTPDAGRVRVLGLDPAKEGRALKARMGLMLQAGGVYPHIRPLEAIRLFASFYPHPLDPAQLLTLVGLEEVGKTRYRHLSGGERQRLSLALALVGRPDVLFLDEPTAAMDPQARRATWQVLLDLKQRGATVVLTTHSMEEAERLADRVAILNQGQLVALGRPEQLARQHAAREIRFTAPAGLNTDALAARLGGAAVREVAAGRYVVEAEATPPLLAALVNWLAEQAALITELYVARPSLEDVFLRLTSRTGEVRS